MIWKLRDWMAGKSSVAGIVDANGGLRVVVTKRWRLKHHVGPGERLFILSLRVREPVEYEKIPRVISAVEAHVRKMT